MNTVQIPVNDTIHLSALRPSDKPALLEHLNDRDIYERTLRIPFPYTEADADYFLRIDAEATAKHGHPVHFAIREASGKLIGGFGFDGLTSGHRAEIGYWLAKPYWGCGIMTDVVRAACEFAFANWKLVRITATNTTAQRATTRYAEENTVARMDGFNPKIPCAMTRKTSSGM